MAELSREGQDDRRAPSRGVGSPSGGEEEPHGEITDDAVLSTGPACHLPREA